MRFLARYAITETKKEEAKNKPSNQQCDTRHDPELKKPHCRFRIQNTARATIDRYILIDY